MGKAKITVENGIVVGNVEDKSHPSNPFAGWLIRRFDQALLELIAGSRPASIHEVGCGEGRLTEKIASLYDTPVRASEYSQSILSQIENTYSASRVQYVCKSIYDLSRAEDFADLIICCEVLEHLDQSRQALAVLKSLAARYYIFSVPREPIWCLLNMARGKYLSRLGNTPGHVNHWSQKGFVKLLAAAGFNVEVLRAPLPWTMVLAKIA